MTSTLTVLGLLDKVHDRVAAFARERYVTEGRGVVLVEFPDLDSSPATVVAALQYTRQSQVHMLFAGRKRGADSSSLVRFLQSYDPSLQAVVNVRVNGQDFVLMTRLDL